MTHLAGNWNARLEVLWGRSSPGNKVAGSLLKIS